MSLSEEVDQFIATCETLVAAIANDRPLTNEEATRVERYCFLILSKIATQLNDK